jgi:hypothetical protein
MKAPTKQPAKKPKRIHFQAFAVEITDRLGSRVVDVTLNRRRADTLRDSYNSQSGPLGSATVHPISATVDAVGRR